MDINAIRNIQSDYIREAAPKDVSAGDQTCGAFVNSARNVVNETNDLQNTAESLEIQFALGDADNTHDLQVAQQKANVALSYTVAVRDKVLDAYNTIMNMQM